MFPPAHTRPSRAVLALSMDYSVTFARHFSRLVWLLLHEPTEINEQKAALRALVTISKDGPVTFATRDWRLVVNDAPLPEALTGVQDLAAQLTGHAVQSLTVSQGAAPADMLGVARILAAEPVPGDGGRAVEEKLRALDARTVHVTTAGLLGVNLDGMEASLTEVEAPAAAAPEAEVPVAAPTSAPPAATPAAVPAVEGAAAPRRSGEHRTSGAGRVTTAVDAAFADAGSNYLAFAAVPTPKGSPADFLAQLDGTH